MSVLAIIYIAGLCQAVFLVAALASLPIRNRYAVGLLIALIVIFSLLLAENVQVELEWGRSVGLGLAIEFALAPLFYFFVRALHRGETASPPRALWHFAPLLIASALLVWLNLGFPGEVSLSNPSMHTLVAAIVLSKIAYFSVYATALLREPMPSAASADRLTTLRNLRRLCVAFVAVYVFTALSFIAFLLDAPFAPDSDVVGGIVLAISLYAIGYFSLVNREAFDLKERYGSSAMPANEAASICRRAVAYLDADENYRDAGLTLSRVARAIGVRAGQLSQALNANGEGGFNHLLNQRRLNAYLAARARPENETKTVLELAFAAGFSSKATFYRVLNTAQPVSGGPLLQKTAPKTS